MSPKTVSRKMTRTMPALLLLLLCAVACLAQKVVAQSRTAEGQDLPQRVTIAGHVRSPASSAIEGAVVRVRDSRGEAVAETVSSAAGAYSISALPTGRYSVEALAKGFAFSRTTKDCRQTTSVDFTLVEGRSVPGTVVDPTGVPIPRAKVWAELSTRPYPEFYRKISDVAEVASATADEEGRFVLEHLDDGSYNLRGQADGYGQIFWQSFTLNRLGIPERLAIVLIPAATVKGVVRDSNGQPVPNAVVRSVMSTYDYSGRTLDRILQRQRSDPYEGDQTRSDSKGRYVLSLAISVLQSSGQQYCVIAHHPDHGISAGHYIIPTVGGATEDVDFVLGIGRNSVSGVVAGPKGEPIPGARVWVASRKQGVSADEAGRFRIGQLPDGLFRVSAGGEGYVEGKSNLFELDGGLERSDIRISLEQAASLRGKVMDADGKSVSEARVRAVPSSAVGLSSYESISRAKVFETTTATDGTFQLSNLSKDAIYTLSVAAEGLGEQTLKDIRADGKEMVLSLEPEASISGIVLDSETEKPLRGLAVRLSAPQDQASSWSSSKNTFTDERGRFRFRSLPSPLRYELTAGGRGMRQSEPVAVSLEEGEQKDGATLRVRPIRMYSGIVREKKSRNPVANALVGELWRSSSPVLSDESGKFKLLSLRDPRIRGVKERLLSEGMVEIPSYPKERDVVEDIVVELVEGKTIRGRVVDKTGKPIAGAHIVASLRQMPKNTLSASDGKFEVTGLPLELESVEIRITHAGFVPTETSGLYQGEAKVASVEIQMQKGGTIAGTVQDEKAQKALAGVRVTVRDVTSWRSGEERPIRQFGGTPFRIAVTDEKGSFRFEHLNPSAKYRLTARSGNLVSTALDTPLSDGISLALYPAPSLSGVVAERETKKPIDGAIVSFECEGKRGTVRSDIDGKFTIANLEPGDYRLSAKADGYCPPYNPNAAYSYPPGATRVKLAGKKSVTDARIELLKGGALRGQVVDAESLPVSGARIELTPKYAGRRSGSRMSDNRATSDQEGRFEIRGLTPEAASFQLRVSRDAFASAEKKFTLPKETLEKEIKVVLERGACSLTGIVRDAENQRPLQGMRLTLSDKETRKRFGFKSCRSNAEGRFRFENLAPSNTYALGGSKEGDRRLVVTSVEDLEIGGANKVKELNLIAYAPLTVRGMVREEETGKPIRNAMVRMSKAAPSSSQTRTANTDSAGCFVIENVQEGEYNILVPRESDRYSSRAESARGSAEIALKRGEKIPELVIEIPRGLSLSGKVVDVRTRQPVGQVKVTLGTSDYRLTLPRSRTVTTNRSGEFKFVDLLPSDKYQLSARGPFASLETPNVTVEKGKDTTGVILAVSPTLSISGTIREEKTYKPVQGITVNLDNPSRSRSYRGPSRVSTDAKGLYEFTGLFSGEGYTVSARGNGLIGKYRETIQLTPGKNANRIDINVHPGLTITGVVQDPETSKPVAGARILVNYAKARSGGALPVQPVTSDSRGRFTASNLEEGEYKLAASLSNSFVLPFTQVTLKKGGAPEPIVLVLRRPLSLSVKVVNAEGQPLGNAEVSIAWIRSDGRKLFQGSRKTEPNGVCKSNLSAQDAESFEITAYHADYGLTTVELSMAEVKRKGETAITLERSPMASISGSVKNHDGSPLKAAQISMRPQIPNVSVMGGFRAKTTTDEAGRYALKVLPDVSYTMTVSKDASVPETRSSLTFGADSSETMDFQLAEGHTISGRVEIDRGVPKPRYSYITLIAQSPGFRKSQSVNLDQGNSFEIKNLKEGAYNIEANMRIELQGKTHTIRASAEEVKTGAKDVMVRFSFASIARVVGCLPPEFTMKDLAGNSVSMDSLKGKVVLVNFWATWVPSCMKETDALERLHKERQNDLVILGICLESNSEQAVKTYVEKRKITYPVILSTREILEAFEAVGDPIDTLPSTIIIDRKGVIKGKRVGAQGKEAFIGAYQSAGAAR